MTASQPLGGKRLRRYLTARIADLEAERVDGADEDVHFTRGLVAAVLDDLTVPGARVLDPFAGFGTTLAVAERMGRTATGIELLPERAQIARHEAPASNVITGDARQLTAVVSDDVARNGPYDLVLTSPPYRTIDDHPTDPLTGYRAEGGDYDAYLRQVTAIMVAASRLLVPNGSVVINIANISDHTGFTPLAWDLARALDAELRLARESFVCWDHDPHDLAGDYLMHLLPRK